jgi:hypothetical protein
VSNGALCDKGAHLDIDGADINSSGGAGVKATGASNVFLGDASITSSTGFDIESENGSTVTVDVGATFSSVSPRLNSVDENNSTVTDGTAPSAEVQTFVAATVVHNFGSIPAHSTTELNVALTGVTALSSSAQVAYNGADVSGITITARVNANDIAVIRATNATAGALSFSNRSYRVICTEVA